jgi:hypothetical protein
MGLWIVQIAEIMYGHHAAPRVNDGQDVGGNEEQVWRAAHHLPGEAQVSPEAREGHDAPFAIRRTQVAGGRAIEVKAIAMVAFQGEEVADQVEGVVLCARSLPRHASAGVNADEHRSVSL